MDVIYQTSLAEVVGWIKLLPILFVATMMLGLPLLVLWLVLRKNKGASGMASCGKCGYQVRGISTLNCPECGADLREVGITKSKSSNAMIWVMVVVGVLIVLMGLCVCSGFILFNVKSSAPTPMGPMMPVPQPMPIPDESVESQDPDVAPELTPDTDVSPDPVEKPADN